MCMETWSEVGERGAILVILSMYCAARHHMRKNFLLENGTFHAKQSTNNTNVESRDAPRKHVLIANVVRASGCASLAIQNILFST